MRITKQPFFTLKTQKAKLKRRHSFRIRFRLFSFRLSVAVREGARNRPVLHNGPGRTLMCPSGDSRIEFRGGGTILKKNFWLKNIIADFAFSTGSKHLES